MDKNSDNQVSQQEILQTIKDVQNLIQNDDPQLKTLNYWTGIQCLFFTICVITYSKEDFLQSYFDSGSCEKLMSCIKEILQESYDVEKGKEFLVYLNDLKKHMQSFDHFIVTRETLK